MASGELFVFASKDFAEQVAAYNTVIFAQLSELDFDGETGLDGLRAVNWAIPTGGDSGSVHDLPIRTKLSK